MQRFKCFNQFFLCKLKNLKHSFLIPILCCFAFLSFSRIPNQAHAWGCCDPEPENYCPEPFYMGLGYKYLQTTTRGEWGRILVKPHPSFVWYFGWRFWETYGLEIGYSWSTNKPKSTPVPAGSSILGITNTTGAAQRVTGTVRFRTGYLDFNVFIPIFPEVFDCLSPELILSAGIESTKARLKVEATPANATPSNPFANRLSQIEGKTRQFLRAGIGLQAFVNDSIGIKAMFRWHQTSMVRAKLNGTNNRPEIQKPFRDGQSVALSVFYTFHAF